MENSGLGTQCMQVRVLPPRLSGSRRIGAAAVHFSNHYLAHLLGWRNSGSRARLRSVCPCDVGVRIPPRVPCRDGVIGSRVRLRIVCPRDVWVRVPLPVQFREQHESVNHSHPRRAHVPLRERRMSVLRVPPHSSVSRGRRLVVFVRS